MSRPQSLRGAGSHWRPLTARLLTVVVVSAALAGCSLSAPELRPEAAKQLQSQVLAVSQAAASNDPASTLKLLDELVTQVDEAAARGEMSFKRHQSISKSIEAVRADLLAQQAQQAAEAAAAAEAARVAAEQEAAAQAAAKADADAAAAAAAATVAPPVVVAPAPAPAPAQPGPGKGGKGKGKDNDD